MLNNSEKDKDFSTLLDEVKLDLLSYTNTRIKLFKLDAFEKLGISASAMGYGLIVITLVFTILFFVLIGLAFFIGELLKSLALGFAILAAFSILVLIIILICGKPLKMFLLNKIIVFLQNLDKNESE